MFNNPSSSRFSRVLCNALVYNLLVVLVLLVTSGVNAQSPHTVVFTGSTSDFNSGEMVAASAGNVNYYMTFDATTIYIGAFASSGSFNSNDNLTIYLDSDPQMTLSSGTGTTAGQSYNGVTGTLPFTANYNMHVEQSYQEARSFAGSWAATISGPTYFTSSTCREIAIPRSSIGNPYGLYVATWMGYNNGIFANAPGASLGSGANPTVVNYFGGIGLSAADCIPLVTSNTPMVDVITDASPALNDVVGALLITSGSHSVSNDFTVAPGGCILVSGGSLNLANTDIYFGGAAAANGKGSQIQVTGGSLVTGASVEFYINGETALLGLPMSFQSEWIVSNKLTFLSGGGTTIGSGGELNIRSGGYINGNAPTYDNGSTLYYNTGGVFTASSEWATGISSGVGVPFNVSVGTDVPNSVLSFGSSASYRRCTNNLTVSNFGTSGLTLSTNNGGDLQIGGNITQNGTFTSNNRAVIFNGSSSQNLTGNWNGTGTTNNLAYLVVSTTVAGGLTINSNTVISANSGNVLELTATGRLNISGGVNLNFINNGGNILVSGGTRTIRFNAGNSSLSINGSKTITNASGGTLSIISLVSGASVNLSQGLNFGSNLSTIGNNVILRIDNGGFVNTNAPTYATGSTLQYNTAAAYGRGVEWSATSGAGYPHHVIISNSGTNLNLGNGGAAVARQLGGNLTINDGCTLSMATTPMTAALSVLGNVTIGNGTSGTLVLSSSAGGNINIGGNVTQSAGSTITHNNRSITLNGTTNQSVSISSSIYDLTLNNANGATLALPLTVSNVLTLTNGNISLGSNNLTLTNSAAGAITGTFGATRMIVASSTGQFVRAIATAGLPINYTWPIGDNVGTTEYTPISLNITANSIARNLGFAVSQSAHPQNDNTPVQTDYISRYWTVSNSAAGTYTYTANATFSATDVTGTQSNIRLNIYDGASWIQDAGSSTTANVITSTTNLSSANAPLTSGNAIAGRVNNGNIYVWNQTGSSNFNTAANWTPSRTTPRLDDILVYNNGATTTSTNVPTQTIGQLLISGNTNVTFTSTAANTLTIGGNNGVDFNIASGSTLVLGSTGNNSIVIAHSNAPTTTIAGTLTINTNNSNNNGINFTNTTAQVTGTINNFGVITSSATNLNFNAASFYNHNFTTSVGTIPTATWNTTSTCRIQGYTSGGGADFTPLGLAQTFGNFTWHCTGQSSDAQLNGTLTSIAGNFVVSETNNRELRLTANTSYNLNIGGNLSLSDNNTTLNLAQNNGNYTVNVTVGGNYTQSNTSDLEMNNGNGGTSVRLFVAGSFNLDTGAEILQSSGGTNNNLIEFNGTSAQTVAITGTLPATAQMNYRVNNSAGINLTGTIPVNASSTFYRRAGSITGGTISYNATSGSLEYESIETMTTGIEWPTTNAPVNVTMNGTSTVSLAADRTMSTTGVFTNTSGVLSLGANTLTLSNTGAGALVNASPSATNMIAASGTGQLRLTLPNSARDLNFYIGDVTGTTEYSGLRLNFSANSVNNRIVGVRVVDDTSSVLSLPYAPIDYLTRHWVVTLSSTAGTYSYTPTMTYSVAGDVEGTQNNLQVAAFPTGASSWNHYATTLVSPTIAKSGAALTHTNFSLNGAVFTGRTPVKYWDGSISTDWSTAGNWTPAGVPVSTDNIDVNGNAINPLVLNTTATVNHFTFSDGGNFTLGASGNLTVAGNLTFSANATTTFNCGSTLNLTNTTFNQTIPAIQYGNLNLGTGNRTLASAGTISICGDYTPTSGTLTSTGSTVQFNGTTAQSIQTNGTSFNVVNINNTSANVNSSVNVTVNGALNIPSSARLNITSNTWTISGGATGSVHGFLRNAGTVTTTGTLTIQPTGVYEHNYTTAQGTVPTATWSVGSLCKFIGYTSNNNAPAGLNQTFHHVEWDCAAQTANLNLTGAMNTINGNLTVTSTGSGQLRLSGGSLIVINILGDYIQNGGDVIFKTGNNNQTTINIGGNFTQTAGYLDTNSGNNGYTQVNLTGNYSRTGSGSLTTSGITAQNSLFLFVGTNQSILHTTSGTTRYCDYHISSGSTTSLLSNFVLNTSGLNFFPVRLDVLTGGTLVCGTYEISGATGVSTRVRVLSGATIRTAHGMGLTASGLVGSVQTDNRVFNSDATYVYNGSINQNTGNFWTITSTPNTVANLIVDNTATSVAMNSGTNVSVTNALTFSASNTAYLNVASNTISVTNSALNAVVRNSVGHVVGNLGRAILPSATNTYTFHVGTTTAYSPVVSALTMGTGAGSIVAKASDGGHPNMATNGLSQTAICNRYWTMSNSGATVNAASHQFNYIPGDLIGGATDALLILGRYSSGWTFPSFTPGVNAITGTALNNTTSFGDFFAAVGCSTYAASITAGGATDFCSGGSVNLTASSNIAGSSFAWSPATGLNVATGSNVVASPTVTTTYTVTATSPQNCVDTETITITVYPMPTATVSGPATACNGATANFVITGDANSAVYYTINGGSTLSALTNGSGLAYIAETITAATTLQLVSIEGDYCTNALSGSWTIQPVVLSAAISGTTGICAGQSTTISFSGTANATIGYQINGGAVQTITLNGAGSASLSTGALFNNTTYTLSYVLSGLCNYPAAGSAVITVTEMPDATFIGGGAVCSGSIQSVQVQGTPLATVNYTINGGATQNVVLDGAGNATITTSPITTTTVYNLVSVNLGACSSNIGIQATFTITGITYYQDLDGDGYGNPSVSQLACTAPIGYVANNGDCNDSNSALHPNTVWYADIDGDGYGSYIYATQCSNPGVANVVLQGGDCNDNNPLVYGGAAEICGNNLDDNCNGLIDEGCLAVGNDSIYFATNVQGYVTSYPFTSAINATLVGASNSPESNSYAGKDRWYKFQAGSHAARIVLSTSTWNGALQLCDATFAPVAGGTENVNSGSGNEIMILTNLTAGQWYYVSVSGVTTGDFGPFALNIQLFYPTGCGTSTAFPLNSCSPFKARSNGASSYTYVFTPVVSGMGGGSVTINGPVVLSNPALGLIPGQSYQVAVSCTFSGLVNGIGQAEPDIVMNASSSCVLTLSAHDDLQVRSSQRCDAPAVLLRSSIMRTDPFVCGVTNYTFEFTPTSGCADYIGTGTTFTHTNIARNISLSFSGATTSPAGNSIQPQNYYIVRVRPNFGVAGANPGTWGTPRIIFIGGTLMTEYIAEEEVESESVKMAHFEVYPNPGNGEMIQLLAEEIQGEVKIDLFDQFGRLVAQRTVFAESGFQLQWHMETPLANGLYHIRVMHDGGHIDRKYLVTR